MLSIGDFLKTKREENDISVKEISELLINKGFKASEKTIYSWESNNSQPTPTVFLHLCHIYNINDILSSFGFKITAVKKAHLNHEENQLIDNFRNINIESKNILINLSEVFLNYEKQKISPPIKTSAPIIDIDSFTKEVLRPLYDTPASAGTGVPIEAYVPHEMVFIPKNAPESVDFGIRISGDSMTPNAPDGSIVWVKKYIGETLQKNKMYVIEINDEAFCKMFDGRDFVSINPKYNNLKIYETDTVRIAGTVLYIEN